MDLPQADKDALLQLLDSRGTPESQLQQLQERFGQQAVFADYFVLVVPFI